VSSTAIRRAMRPLLLAVSGTVLAACSLFQSASDSAVQPRCPRVLFVGDARHAFDFTNGLVGEADALRVHAYIADFSGLCVIDSDEQVIELELELFMLAERYAALEGQSVTLPYVVTILDRRDDRILGQSVLDATFSFDGAATAGIQEDLEPVIPLEDATDGSHIDVTLGWQLDPSQIAYNQRQRAAGTLRDGL